MKNIPHQRVLSMAVVLAMTLGNLILPGQAFSEWTVGDPMVFYWGFPTDLTDEVAQQAVDGGYNLVWVYSQGDLPVAQTHGLRVMWAGDMSDSTIDDVRRNSAVYAYFVTDEPSAAQFDSLQSTVAHLKTIDPEHPAYINLFPNYASNEQLGTDGYQQYLSQFINTVQPVLLSYDHYQLMTTGDTSRYLENLAAMSTVAKQAGVPFVNIVQGCAYFLDWRVPNANELRFLAYSTLAYGAQGISYFAYVSDDADPNDGGIKPFPDGTPTSVYTALTPINHEFVKIAKQYQPLEWIGTYLEGYNPGSTPPGTTLLPGSGSPFSISPVIPTDYADGAPLKGVLLGFFDTDGSTLADATFALVVNLDYSATKTYTVTGPGDLSVFNATTGQWTAMGSNQVTLDLAPGGGVLLGLTSLIIPEPLRLYCWLPVCSV